MNSCVNIEKAGKAYMFQDEVFNLNSKCVKELMIKDEKLKLLFNIVGSYKYVRRRNYFVSMARIIVGQQLSINAANSIWGRINNITKLKPDRICSLSHSDLKAAGLSDAKVTYLKNLATLICYKNFDLESLDSCPNDIALQKLMDIKGIGRWSAETFLIFSLGRLDVLPIEDVGIKRAIQWLHNMGNPPNKNVVDTLSRRWAPHQGVVALYLWEAVNRDFIKAPLGSKFKIC